MGETYQNELYLLKMRWIYRQGGQAYRKWIGTTENERDLLMTDETYQK